MIQSNIDRTDAAAGTKAPFTYESTLKINHSILPSMSFLSIRVKCMENILPPVRFSHVTLADGALDACMLHLKDSSGNYIGHIKMYAATELGLAYVTSFIQADSGALRGHASYSAETPAYFLDAARAGGGSFRLPDSSFVLLPQCCTADMHAGASVITAGQDSVQDVTLASGAFLHTDVQTSGDAVSMKTGLAGEYKNIHAVNGLCRLVLDAPYAGAPESDAVWLGGKHLVIKSSIASNLRVLEEPEGCVKLTGVLDA